MWGCSGHCRRRRLHCHRSRRRRHPSAARRVAGAGDWGLVRSPEARARGAAGPSRGKLSALGVLRAGSRPPARAPVVTTLPPRWVRAPGHREASAGRGRWAAASSESAGPGLERPARTRARWRGVAVYTARVARGGESVRAPASTLLCLLQLLHIYGAPSFSASN